MNPKTIATLYKKELLEVLRDKKSVIITLLLPLILYPVLFLVMGFIMSMVESHEEKKEYTIAIPEAYEITDDLWRSLSAIDEQLVFVEADDAAAALEVGEIRAYLTAEEKDDQTQLTVYYRSSESDSESTVDALYEAVDEYLSNRAEENVRAAGLSLNETLYPVQIEDEDFSSVEESMGNAMAAALPVMLIIFVFTSTFPSAMDMTSGERERGTMELLLTFPVSTLELITGKFLAVATVAMATTFVNTLSVGIFMVSLGHMVTSMGSEDMTFHLAEFLPGMCVIFVCVLAFALFISAVSMCICAFAKTFKEASNYMSPLMMVVMLTGYAAFIPDVRLSAPLAAVPVANICLLIKDAVSFRFEPVLILIVLFTNILYAFAAIWALSRIYTSESVLFGEGGFNIRLFELRKNIKKGNLPTIQEMIFLYVIWLILNLYIGFFAGLTHQIPATIILQLLLAVLPLAACWYFKADFPRVYSVKPPTLTGIAGGVVAIVGSVCLAQVMAHYLAELMPESMENVQETMGFMENLSLPAALLLIAVLPAVCEELFFRGYVFCAVRQKMKAGLAIVLTAFLFALYHMSLVRLPLTFLPGILMTIALYYTGSIFVPMIMHFLNNAIAVLLMFYGDAIPGIQEGTFSGSAQIVMVVIAAVCIPAGILILRRSKKSDG
ncbi:MAG: CPBP family intramembrane metalloprotease [Lachnospiraceae bacterium]|nr:CPBP family intramembrane metalloprotease [Lachnospiraceae bacterium]